MGESCAQKGIDTHMSYPYNPPNGAGYPQADPSGYPHVNGGFAAAHQAGQYPTPGGYPQHNPQHSAPPPVQATIDDFYRQPTTGGGKALSFSDVGTTYTGTVARDITAGDIQQQTDTQGRPLSFRNGQPKLVMKVPLHVTPDASYPDGVATWYVKGQAREELVQAMTEAGAPAGPPEAGATVTVTYIGQRANGGGLNPTKLFQVRYQRSVTAIRATQEHPPVPAPAAPVASAPPAAAGAPAAVAPVSAASTSTAAAPAAPAAPAGLTAEQQALFDRITGTNTAA